MSVIVPAWKRLGSLELVLGALANQDDSDFEVVVVSDGPDDRLRNHAASYPGPLEIRWIFHDENRGLPAARNTGVRASAGSLLLFLDDDVIPAADWLSHHRARHEREGPRTIVLGHLTEEYASEPESQLEEMLRARRAAGYEAFFARCVANGGTFDFAPHCGNNSSLSRESFDEIGGFDEKQRAIHEDLEMGARARAIGMRFVYEPLARALHRNEREAASYDVERSEAGALSDLRRARELRQHTAVKPLLAMSNGSARSRIRARAAWAFPRATERIGSELAGFALQSRSARLLNAGRNLQATAAYWTAVRNSGETAESIAVLTGARTPAFVMHGVSIEPVGEERRHHLGAAHFGKLMRWLARSGRQPRDADALLAGRIRGGSVLLTFDDGYDDIYTHAMPLLAELGIVATVFVVAGHVGGFNDWDNSRGFRRRKMLTREQLASIHSAGMRIGSHSVTHPNLTSLDQSRLDAELRDSKHALEDIIGAEVTSFAYPVGAVNERVRNAVAAAGYATAFTAADGLNQWPDPFLISRASLSESDSIASFAIKLATGRGLESHRRRALIAATKLALRVFPAGIEAKLSRIARDADARALTRRWNARTKELADIGARSGGDSH